MRCTRVCQHSRRILKANAKVLDLIWKGMLALQLIRPSSDRQTVKPRPLAWSAWLELHAKAWQKYLQSVKQYSARSLVTNFCKAYWAWQGQVLFSVRVRSWSTSNICKSDNFTLDSLEHWDVHLCWHTFTFVDIYSSDSSRCLIAYIGIELWTLCWRPETIFQNVALEGQDTMPSLQISLSAFKMKFSRSFHGVRRIQTPEKPVILTPKNLRAFRSDVFHQVKGANILCRPLMVPSLVTTKLRKNFGRPRQSSTEALRAFCFLSSCLTDPFEWCARSHASLKTIQLGSRLEAVSYQSFNPC